MQKFYKTLTIALACVIMAGFASCNEEDVARTYTVSPRDLEFSAAGGTQTVYVSGDSWEATTEDGWIELKMEKGKIIVTVDANETAEVKSGLITVDILLDAETTDTKTIKVTQRVKGAPDLTVDKEELEFTAEGGTNNVVVTSELEWTVTTEDEWISVAKAGKSFRVNVSKNETAGIRTGSITVDNGENTKTITVEQEVAE